MRLLDKIKRRLELYSGLVKQRKEIENLYYSFDEASKREFWSMLKFNLIRTLKPYFLFEGKKGEYNFYSFKDKVLVFGNYIFKPVETEENFQREFSILIEEILITKVYKDKEIDVEQGDVVLDCGANVGIFSVYVAKKAKMVYAFEPSENERIALSENKRINHCDNIEIIPKAVSDKTGVAKLVSLGTCSHYLTYSGNKAPNIQTISIDEFIKEEGLEKVDFIKMDIEGSEEKALLGAKETLRRFKPKLAISIYHTFNDFYKLPLLIKRLNPNYKIKVRNKSGTLMAYAI